MEVHANAALSLNARRRLARRVVEQGWSLGSAAAAAEVSERTARKWAQRYREEGEAGLLDRSSAPKRVWNRTCERRIEAIAALRRLRMTAAQIAACLGMPEQTVSGILTRIGMGRLGRLGLEPERRYERSRPGELVHVDVKKLGRIQLPGHRVTGNRSVRARRTRVGNEGCYLGTAGWEFVHIAIDDATRLAYVEVLGDEKAATAIAFFKRALRFFARYGIKVERVLSDNGACYRSKLHALACRTLGIRHLRTRPYRPQTNGKAERFIRTMLAGWAYGAVYRNSSERNAALDGWLWHYNHERRHRALNRQTPAARLTELNNLLRSYS
jgi:transposase InsO family protein